MNRLTKASGNGKPYIIDKDTIKLDEAGYAGEAVEQLAKFENIYEHLTSRQVAISKELEKLRGENKMKTVKFKQLLAEKLTNNNILILFENYGLK